MSVRTPELEKLYCQKKAAGELVPLIDVHPIKEWYYWKLIKNDFPHDKIVTSAHYMLVLKRKCPDWWDGMKNNEIMELFRTIIPELDPKEQGHHFIKINLEAMRSISEYPHFHVCEYLPEFV